MEKPFFKFSFSHTSGQAALTAVIFFLFISLAVIAGLSFSALREVRIVHINFDAKRSYFLAEGAVEENLVRIVKQKQYTSPETLALDGFYATTTITNVATNEKRLTSVADANHSLRKIDVRFRTGVGSNFYYGVQVGAGGLEMANNAQVQGSIYSNGNILGDSGATITGDVYAGGPTTSIDSVTISGNANAHIVGTSTIGGDVNAFTFDNGTAGGNVNANLISDCTISGTAAYNERINCSVTGSVTTPTTSPSDPAQIQLPISTETLDGWKEDAEAGGVCIPPSCLANGDYAPAGCSISLGPKKITGSLILDASCAGGQVLTVTGTIWVQGSIDISNGAKVSLSPSYGALSGIVVTDGWIHLANNGSFSGSGSAGSFLMFLTTVTGGGHHESAIDLHNNADGAVFYAQNGMVYLHNNVHVIELIGYKVHLENNAVLTYQNGLANIQFSSGPSGGYDIREWKEIE